MPGQLPIHLDEHADPLIAAELRRRGVDVTTTDDAELGGATDVKQLAFADRTGRVIYTHDDDFTRLHHGGHLHAGIAFCPSGTRTIGQVIEGLELIAKVATADEMRNTLYYL